jgi:hypothetical protein
VESTPYPYPFGHFLHLEIFTPYVQPLDLELTDISIVTHTKKKKKKKKKKQCYTREDLKTGIENSTQEQEPPHSKVPNVERMSQSTPKQNSCTLTQ